ncbi:ORF5 [Leucania separata nucleopolyhedrovirus]|uniref:ORF5 n=1 Tax=Leucania separata nucleopolyhedrovirus TaxID=1307956 RepID=Q0ILB4_NPVLS|nr:ORF5 [Leucania separata nucleopolyhedrovirus]AAR28769.1 ORF5 [Leucania separata nucleopolyhedrovirus]
MPRRLLSLLLFPEEKRRHWVGTCLPLPSIRSTTKWKTWPLSGVIDTSSDAAVAE